MASQSLSANLAGIHQSNGILEGCSDACGWIAALVSMLAYGTYGVPIKETMHIVMPAAADELNPLIFQTYKSVVMFGMAPLVVLLLAGVPYSFTPWGILSGLLWVLGGTAGVVAIRWAGMATAIGTWASVMIAVNFVWGILVFQEPVSDMRKTVAAFALLTLGLIGMSRYGAPSNETTTSEDDHHVVRSESDDDDKREIMESRYSTANESVGLISTSDRSGVLRRMRSEESALDQSFLQRTADTTTTPESLGDFIISPSSSFNAETHVRVCRVVLRKRIAGILAAIFNGLMSGSSLIPLHYAKRHGFGGVHYIISYATGALLANIGIWLVYYAVLLLSLLQRKRGEMGVSWKARLQQASENMPECHFRRLWKTGLCAGTYSIRVRSNLLPIK